MWRGWTFGGARLIVLTLQNAQNSAITALIAIATGTVMRRGSQVGVRPPTSGSAALRGRGEIRHDLFVDLDQALARLRPRVLGPGPESLRAQPREELAIAVQRAELRRQRVDVADAVHERVLAVAADVGAGVRDHRDGAAAERLDAHEPEALLDAGQDEDVAAAHELRDVGAVAERLDARVSEHVGELLGVVGQELAG